MVEETTPNDCASNSPEEASAPPRDSVSGVTQPDTILNEKDPQEHQCTSHQDAEPTIPRPPEKRRDGYKFWAIVLSTLTLLVLIANAYLVVRGHELVRNDQRAWVGVARIDGPSNDALDLGATVYVGNFGKGPALMLEQRLNNRLLPCEEPFTAHYGDAKTSSVGVLWPGTEHMGNFPSHTWKEEEIDAVKLHESVLYRYGEIRYKDVFDRPHKTTFCDRLIYRRSAPVGWAWQVNDSYNTAD